VPVGLVVPGEPEPPTLNPTDDLQQVRAAVAGVLLLAEGGMHGPVEALLVVLRPGIPLAEVVERDLRSGGGQPFPRRVGTQVAQGAEAQPVSGIGPSPAGTSSATG